MNLLKNGVKEDFDMRDIKTVIFDLGGVYFTDGTKGAIDIISKRWNLDPVLVADVFKGKIGTAYRENQITHEEFWRQAKKTLGIDAPTDELALIWLNGYVPIEGTVNIIKELKDNGYEIIYLSDNVQERIDYLEERYHFLQYFKSGVFSHIAGVRKPNPKIYQLALAEASYPAKNCVYIDDKPNLLEEADKLGMATIAFTNPDSLRTALVSLGVKLPLSNTIKLS